MAAPLDIIVFPDINKEAFGELSADITAGDTTFDVVNVSGFAVDEDVIIGTEATEVCELAHIAGISGNTVQVSTPIGRDHRAHEPVTQLFGSVARIFRGSYDSTAKACPVPSASYTLFDSVNLQVDRTSFIYPNPSGSDQYCYKVTYQNPVTGAETDLLDSPPVRGNDTSHWVTVEEVKKSARFTNNRYVDDSIIASRRDEAENFVLGVLAAAHYPLPFTSRPPIIRNIMRELATAFVHLIDYSDAAEGTTKFWQDRKQYALEMLDWVANMKEALVDDDGETILPRTASLRFWPNASTATASEEEQGGKRQITSKMKL